MNETVDAVNGWKVSRLSWSPLELALAPQVGGRIVSLSYDGHELLFCDPEANGRLGRAGSVFPITGGDKTWIAPQGAWPGGLPPLDLDAGEYSLQAGKHGRAARLESPVCRQTGMRIRRRVEVTSAHSVRVEAWAENVSNRAARWSAWNVTQILRPFDVWVSMAPEGLRPYDFSDSYVLYLRVVSAPSAPEAHGWTRIRAVEPGEFKFGGVPIPRNGAAAAVAMRGCDDGILVWGIFFDSVPGAAYAHDASFEIYNHPLAAKPYLEIETHVPLRELAPGDSSHLRQDWVIGTVPASFANDPSGALGWLNRPTDAMNPA